MPLKVRSKVPVTVRLALAPKLTALASVRAEFTGRIETLLLNANGPVPAAVSVPSARMPAFTVTPPPKELAPPNNSVPISV